MTTAIYMRVSTDRQETRLQLRDLLSWLADQGLPWRSVRWFRDRGHSSAAKSRPAWDRLMAAIHAGQVKRLVCWKQDRLNRWGVKDHLRWRLAVDAFGVEVISLTEPDAVKFDDIMDVMRECMRAEARREWLETHTRRITAGVRASIKVRGAGNWGGANVVDPSRPGCAKLTPGQWDGLYRRWRAGENRAALAREAGIAAQTVRAKFRRMDSRTP